MREPGATEVTGGRPLRILLVDDHAFLRAGTRRILEDEPDLEVVGEAGTGSEALGQLDLADPDIVLLDIGLPDMNGIALCQALRRQRPEQRIVVLTGYNGEILVRTLYEMGVDGYFLKTAAPQELVAGIRAVCQGERAYCSEALRIMAQSERAGAERPTHKELEVVRALAQGLKNRDIADRLQLSENTVEYHIRRLFSKLGASSRTEVIVRAQQLGWLDTQEPLC
jgi:two-component system NarL family response regulator